MIVFRIIGGMLVLLGLLFCFTIIGAFIGIPMMLVGAILLAIGGRRKTVITNVVQVTNAPGMPADQFLFQDDRRPANYLDMDTSTVRPPIKEINPPRVALENLHRMLTAETNTKHNRREPTDRYTYDRAKWNALVEYDPDIARIAAVLKPYGAKYTDQFASAYLAINDKNYLAVIVQKIIATAKQDAAQRS